LKALLQQGFQYFVEIIENNQQKVVDFINRLFYYKDKKEIDVNSYLYQN